MQLALRMWPYSTGLHNAPNGAIPLMLRGIKGTGQVEENCIVLDLLPMVHKVAHTLREFLTTKIFKIVNVLHNCHKIRLL